MEYFIQNIQKVNMVGPRDSNIPAKTYGGPCMIKELQKTRAKTDFDYLISALNFMQWTLKQQAS